MMVVPFKVAYPHEGRADKQRYLHNRRADSLCHINQAIRMNAYMLLTYGPITLKTQLVKGFYTTVMLINCYWHDYPEYSLSNNFS